jgi:N-acetylneuraminic acid mutarotase
VAIGILSGKVHVTGGQSIQPLKTFAEHLVLDPKSGSWSPAAEMPTPRHGLASAVLNGDWYVVGGGKGAGVFTAFTASDTVEVFQGN